MASVKRKGSDIMKAVGLIIIIILSLIVAIKFRYLKKWAKIPIVVFMIYLLGLCVFTFVVI